MKILTFPETLRSKISEQGFPHISFTMARKKEPEFNQIHLFIPVGITTQDIENSFRKYMYPKSRGLGALEYPPTFRIKFMSGGEINNYMPRIIDTYLTAMSVNYNATGNSFHMNDSIGAAPVEIDLNMTFQEVRAITRDDLYGDGLSYKEGYDNAGTFVSSPDNNTSSEKQSNTGEGP
jgi:hypothetical protein